MPDLSCREKLHFEQRNENATSENTLIDSGDMVVFSPEIYYLLSFIPSFPFYFFHSLCLSSLLDSFCSNFEQYSNKPNKPSDVEPPSNIYPNQMLITVLTNCTDLKIISSNFVTKKSKY